jgi:hypothetical protein
VALEVSCNLRSVENNYSFKWIQDSSFYGYPVGLIAGSDGYLYGTTTRETRATVYGDSVAAAHRAGSLFKLDPDGYANAGKLEKHGHLSDQVVSITPTTLVALFPLFLLVL